MSATSALGQRRVNVEFDDGPRREVAIAICREIRQMTKRELSQRVPLRRLEERLPWARETVLAGVRFALEKSWLLSKEDQAEGGARS
jgi:hypothetical protein